MPSEKWHSAGPGESVRFPQAGRVMGRKEWQATRCGWGMGKPVGTEKCRAGADVGESPECHSKNFRFYATDLYCRIGSP